MIDARAFPFPKQIVNLPGLEMFPYHQLEYLTALLLNYKALQDPPLNPGGPISPQPKLAGVLP
jgi:hypothetical protein